MLSKKLLALKNSQILMLVGLIYLATLVFNDGFMALDEYWVGITRYIPSQHATLTTLVGPDDVKSPLQILPMHLVASAALKVGIAAPYWQYRSVIFVIGLLNVLLLLLAFVGFSRVRNQENEERNFSLLMLGFYFAAPFAFTRPMFESLGAPWLALASVLAMRYEQTQSRSDLLWGVVCASMAFVLRQQLGICALIFVALPLIYKRGSDFLYASALGLGLFILSGIPDFFLRGEFHFSLRHLLSYNVEHGGDYGHQPITFYPLVILAITFFPFFIAKYPEGFVRRTLRSQKSLWSMLFLFVFLHSLFPQKWERFIISVVPLLIFIAEPFLFQLHQNFYRHKKRLVCLYTLNGILFFTASFFPPQKNLIALSTYLNAHPQIKRLYRVENTPEWITDAFILDKQYEFIDVPPSVLSSIDWKNCENALVLGMSLKNSLPQGFSADLVEKAYFPVNWIEELSYRLNKKNNVRRTALQLYGCGGNDAR